MDHRLVWTPASSLVLASWSHVSRWYTSRAAIVSETLATLDGQPSFYGHTTTSASQWETEALGRRWATSLTSLHQYCSKSCRTSCNYVGPRNGSMSKKTVAARRAQVDKNQCFCRNVLRGMCFPVLSLYTLHTMFPFIFVVDIVQQDSNKAIAIWWG